MREFGKSGFLDFWISGTYDCKKEGRHKARCCESDSLPAAK